MWWNYWGLARDPFARDARIVVPTAPYLQATQAIRKSIEAGERSMALIGEPGVGKSTALKSVLRALRSPSRRCHLATSLPGEPLVDTIAHALEIRESSVGWRAIESRLQLLRLQGVRLLLALDDADERVEPPEWSAFESLLARNLGCVVAACLEAPAALETRHVLAPMSRSDAQLFLSSKLRSAGADPSVFTPKVVSRLHAASFGRPDSLDRLAARAMRTAAEWEAPSVSLESVEAALASEGWYGEQLVG